MFIKTTCRPYEVEVEIEERSGQVIRETWRNADGEVDRLNDLPAVTQYCPTSGRITKQQWWRGSDLHRDGDKPAQLTFDPTTGQEVARSYWTRHKLDRGGDLPSVITRSPSGSLLSSQFFAAGKRHRTNGPAVEGFDEKTGTPTTREFWLDDARVEPF